MKISYLLEHVGIYTGLFLILNPLVLGLTILQGIAFSLLNGLLHMALDFVNGKYKMKYVGLDEPKYLTVVGIDHTLHLIILITSYVYLFPNAINSFSVIF